MHLAGIWNVQFQTNPKTILLLPSPSQASTIDPNGLIMESIQIIQFPYISMENPVIKIMESSFQFQISPLFPSHLRRASDLLPAAAAGGLELEVAFGSSTDGLFG